MAVSMRVNLCLYVSVYTRDYVYLSVSVSENGWRSGEGSKSGSIFLYKRNLLINREINSIVKRSNCNGRLRRSCWKDAKSD